MQINVNDERELSLPERRPFFRDGSELFDLPLRLYLHVGSYQHP